MNEYQRFIQDELDRRNWRAADIEKHGGPSRQVVSTILKDKRAVLDHRPKQETVEGLAKAFNVRTEVVLAHVALAMGFPIAMEAASLDDVSDEDLLDQIRKRMNRESSEHDTDEAHQDDQSINVVEGNFPAEDVEPEQKIAAYDRDLGDDIGPGDLPEDS